MRALTTVIVAVATTMLLAPAASAEADFAGSKDHPLFNRMPSYFISDYLQKDFDQFQFEVGDGEHATVEGRCTHIVYQANAGAALASPIQIARNYQNAIKKIGGAVISEWTDGVGGATTMKLVRGTDEVWARVAIGDSGFNYVVDVVERAGMKQEITAKRGGLPRRHPDDRPRGRVRHLLRHRPVRCEAGVRACSQGDRQAAPDRPQPERPRGGPHRFHR